MDDLQTTIVKLVPEQLLGVRATTQDDGTVQIVLDTRLPDGTYSTQLLVIDQEYVANMLRREVTTVIPERPRVPADAAEVQRRLAYIARQPGDRTV